MYLAIAELSHLMDWHIGSGHVGRDRTASADFP